MQDYRIYLDYNATAPLAKKVKSFLASGFFHDANSSAQHTSGKLSKKEINLTTKTIHKIFSIKDSTHSVIYHSGATEGVNLVIQGFLKSNFKNCHFIFIKTDHKCVLEQIPWLVTLGAQVSLIDVNQDNMPDIKQIKKILDTTNMVTLLNLTWVNNETGHIIDLDFFEKLKSIYPNLFIHVDSAQVVGKINGWSNLNKNIDAWTFSGHKFGALKGVGYSVLKTGFTISPLVYGGGHQANLRSGTENSIGVKTLALALEEIQTSVDIVAIQGLKNSILNILKKYNSKLTVIEKNTVANTINIVFNDLSSDKLLPYFDMSGVDVSSGSACNSGSSKNSHVLSALGFEDRSKNGIRISLPLYDFDKSIITGKIEECFLKIFSL